MYVYIVYEKLHVHVYIVYVCTMAIVVAAVHNSDNMFCGNSIIGSRLEDIRAVADVIGSLKGSNRKDEPSADAGAMLVLFVVWKITVSVYIDIYMFNRSEENISSTTADRGRKLSFHIASTPAAHSSISQQGWPTALSILIFLTDSSISSMYENYIFCVVLNIAYYNA